MKKIYSILILISVSLLLLFGTNSYSQDYSVRISLCHSTTTSPTLSFTGTTPNANGAGTFTLVYWDGDFDGTGSNLENLVINGETGPALGNTNPQTPQCTSNRDSVTFSIPMADINAWAATGGSIDILLVPDANVNPTLCNATGWCVEGFLTYPVSTVPNDAGASTFTPSIICPGSSPVQVQVNNYGTNQIDSVWLNWSKNGVLQTPIQITTLLDTAAGTGPSFTLVSLGSHVFTPGVTDTFTAWTSMPNGVVDTTVVNDSSTAGIKPSLSGTFTIGGASPDYANFSAALTDLINIGICGPVTFNVRQGTYTEQVDIGSITGSSSINTVTFQADPANTSPAVLTFAPTSSNNYVLNFSGASYVTIDSLTITATGTTYGNAVRFASADYVTVKNCEINASATSTSSLSVPIRNETGVNVEHCTIENNKLNNGYYGMYWWGGNTSTKEIGNVIKNNVIKNFNTYGVQFYYQAGGVFEGNTLEQMTTATSTSYGLYVNYCDSSKIRGNEINLYGSGTNYGLYLAYNYGSATNKVEVINNMISTSTTNTATTYGMYLNYGRHINVYHNSVNCQGGSATAGRACYITGSTSTLYGDMDVRNNVFVNSGQGVALYALSGATTGFLTNLDYNIYQSAGLNLLSLSGTNHTLATWTSATSLDSNSINGVPGFVTGRNLRLQGGIAADAGANVGVMTDIDGDIRPLAPSTGYDIGADEYIPPTCPMGYGLNAFNLTATGADVTWTPGTNDTTWIFEYGAPGFTPGTGTSLFSTNDTASISGLTPVTLYDVYVRGICGVGDTSLYFGPFTFRTRCVSTMAGFYTIDGGTPTGGTNYNSFADAMNALNNCGISAPTTFHVKQGTYNEQVDIGAIIGTSTTNTITFKADPTNTSAAILTYAATLTATNYVVQFSGADNIIFDSLTVNATGTSYGYGFRFMNADHCTVRNCNINSASNTSSLQVPIYNESGVANITQNCTIENNILTKGYYSMYWYGGSTAAKEIGNSILDNHMSDFYFYGLMCYYQGGNRVEGNTIEQMPSAPTTSYGMYIYYNDSAKIKSNKVTLTGAGTNYGMYVAYNYGSAVNKTEIQNNMISTSPSSTGICYGMYLAYGKHINIYHNSIHVQGGSSTGGRGFYLLGSTTTTYGNINIRNNIFSNSGLGEGMYINTGAISTFLDDMDNNIYDAASGKLINQNGTLHTALSTYVAATGLDSNSLNGFPGFISGTDLHLQGAIAYDNGDPTVGVMTDIDGDTRPLAPSTGWDIGADEYIPPSCPSPYSIKLDSVNTTTAIVSWTNGPADSIWEVQYGTPGFTLGTGTTVNLGTNPVSISGLTHSTCYELWLRSICTVGDTSVWMGPFKFCTECAPVTDYCTDFELDATGSGTIPFCWKTYVNTTGNGYIQVNSSATIAQSGTNYVYFYGGNDTSATLMLIAPRVTNLNAGTHRANFWLRADTSVIVGTMSDPTNPGTFNPWDTLQGLSNSSMQNYKVDFRGYTGTDTYVCIFFRQHVTFDYAYLDDYCWEAVPSCEKAPSVQILSAGVDSTSMDIGWNLDTAQVSYIVAYGPVGYDPLLNPAGGDTNTTTINFETVTGLRPLTEYCFWVKAICTNGDTSFWDGPYCAKTGCPSGVGLPYSEDFADYRSVFPLDETPQCWEEAVGSLVVSGGITTMTESKWEPDGFGNVGTTGAARFNFPTFGTTEGWIVTPTFDFGPNPNIARIIEFDVALTDDFSALAAPNGFTNDDTVAFVVSYDQGITWKRADILMQWDTSNEPSHLGTRAMYTMRNTSGLVKFGFYGVSSIANTGQGVDFFVDNFSIRDTTFVGLDENSLDITNFRIYPNPNTGIFTILNEGGANKTSVKVLDVQGRMVYDETYFFSENGRKVVDIHNLNAGVYILLLQSEGKLEQHRIILSK
jgi:hypothetical protein